MAITSIADNKFTLIQPITAKEAELCKYKYSYVIMSEIFRR